MNIIAISGSLRQHSLNTRLLEAAAQHADSSMSIRVLDISAVPLYNEDLDTDSKPAAVSELLEHISAADGLLLASPEYNHATSAVLKNVIDWASRPAFQSPLANKPIGLLSASMSPIGGARAQADLRNVLASTLSLVVPAIEFLLPNAHQAFDEVGNLTDETALRRLNRYLSQLGDWIQQTQPEASLTLEAIS